MADNSTNRRTFLKQCVTGTAAGVVAANWTTGSLARTLGANERINVGLIGCGGRGRYLVEHGLKASGQNAGIVAVCDIWKPRLEAVGEEMAKTFGQPPARYADYRALLADKNVDAVIIATVDHQHAAMATDAILAGKHVYVEKPIVGLACDLGDLNKLYDTARNAKVAIQNGTQGASSRGAQAIRQLIAERKLGKLFRVESTETLTAPYWVNYPCPKSQEEVDWKAFLFNRPNQPFDGNLYGKWMGYREITAGTIGGWMVHFLNTVHYVTGAGLPTSAVAWGGRYAPTNDPKCTAPDQTMVVVEYAEGFHTQFVTHFGSSLNNETTTFMFEKGCIKCQFGHAPGIPVMSSEGVDDSIKPTKLVESDDPPALVAHVRNWLECARDGKQPNADMEFGYKHGIAVVLGDVAWNTGKRATLDPQKREVRT